MMKTWSGWKRFPQAQSGEHVEAPIGPGVYEVRHSDTGRLIAFGYTGNVANALTDLKVQPAGTPWSKLFRKDNAPAGELEYRTYAATTRSEARTAAQRLSGLRQTYWRRRMVVDWTGGQPA